MRTYTFLIAILLAVGASAQPLAKFDEASKKYYYINDNGNKICDPIYDYATDFMERERAAVKKDNKWFFINQKLDEITPRVDSIDMDFHKNFDFIFPDLEVLKKDCCYYLYNIKTKKASPGFKSINLKYRDEFYLYNLLIVNTDLGIVFLDINKLTMSPAYDSFFFDPYYYYSLFNQYWMRRGNKIYITNNTGKPLYGFDYVEQIDLLSYEDRFSYKNNGKWNMYVKGKPILKFDIPDENYFGMPWDEQYIYKLNDRTYLLDGLYENRPWLIETGVKTDPEMTGDTHINDVLIGYEENQPILFKREKFGYMDPALNIVIPPALDSAYRFDRAGHACVKQGNTWGVIDVKGNYVVPSIYDDLIPTNDTDAFIAKKDGKYGVISASGEIRFPFEHNSISKGYMGYIVQKDGKYGLVSSYFFPMVDYKYDALREIKGQHLLFENGPLKGIYDIKNKREVFSGKYKELEASVYSNYLFHRGEQGFGELLTYDGNVLVSGNFDGFMDVGNNFIALRRYNKTASSSSYSIYNLATQTHLPNEYEDIGKYSEGMIPVKINSKYGYINESGELKIPAIYSYVGPFINGKATAYLGKKYIYIDKDGKQIKNKK